MCGRNTGVRGQPVPWLHRARAVRGIERLLARWELCGRRTGRLRPGGAGTGCSKAIPCGLLEDGLKTNKPIIKFGAGTVADSKTTTIDAKAVTIVAEPGARLDRTGDGVILQIQSTEPT